MSHVARRCCSPHGAFALAVVLASLAAACAVNQEHRRVERGDSAETLQPLSVRLELTASETARPSLSETQTQSSDESAGRTPLSIVLGAESQAALDVLENRSQSLRAVRLVREGEIVPSAHDKAALYRLARVLEFRNEAEARRAFPKADATALRTTARGTVELDWYDMELALVGSLDGTAVRAVLQRAEVRRPGAAIVGLPDLRDQSFDAVFVFALRRIEPTSPAPSSPAVQSESDDAHDAASVAHDDVVNQCVLFRVELDLRRGDYASPAIASDWFPLRAKSGPYSVRMLTLDATEMKSILASAEKIGVALLTWVGQAKKLGVL